MNAGHVNNIRIIFTKRHVAHTASMAYVDVVLETKMLYQRCGLSECERAVWTSTRFEACVRHVVSAQG